MIDTDYLKRTVNGRPAEFLQLGDDRWVAAYTDKDWNGGWFEVPAPVKIPQPTGGAS